MDKLIEYIKKRLCYENSFWWGFLLTIVQLWKIFFYVLMPCLVLWGASNSYIAVSNQLKLGKQLDRIEKAQKTDLNASKEKYIAEWIGHPPRENIE